MNLKIKKFYSENTETDFIDFEFDEQGDKPSWIHIKTPEFKARFITIQTSSRSEVLYKRFTGNFYYPIDLVLQPEEEKRFYDKFAIYYDENTAKNNLPMAKFLLEKLNKYQTNKNEKILDAGAGTGIFSNVASENGFKNLTLVDIYKSMLDMAKKKVLLKNAKFIIGDIETVKFPDIYESLVSIMMFDALDDVKLEKAIKNIRLHHSSNAYIYLVEVKKRDIYLDFFTEVESGLFDVSKDKGFQKYYFVGKVKHCDILE